MALPKQRDSGVEDLIEKIRAASPETRRTIELFIDFAVDQDQRTDPDTRVARTMSEAAFSKVWDNPDDAVYDKL